MTSILKNVFIGKLDDIKIFFTKGYVQKKFFSLKK